MRRNDPLILGGGPAGSAAAIVMARSGATPLIVERARDTGDALCGGFVSWRTLASLAQLGLDATLLDGHPITHLRVFAGQRSAVAPLPRAAIGISRRRLDTLLLTQAQRAGARVERGISVRAIDDDGNVRLADHSALAASAVFLATGKHDVRGIARGHGDAGDRQTLGLRIMLTPHPALTSLVGGAIELHLFDGGYCGILLNETGQANVCLAVRKARLSAAGGNPAALLHDLGTHYPALGERLAFLDAAPRIDAVAAVPYGWSTRDTQAGLFKLGDQAAVIPSLAGEGNGIALASGIAAGAAWIGGGARAARPYQTDFARRTRRPVGIATWLWHRGETPITAGLATTILRRFPTLGGALAGLTRIAS